MKDSRLKRVSPTPKVFKTAERCAVIAEKVIEEALYGMSEQEKSACLSSLMQIITNLTQPDK